MYKTILAILLNLCASFLPLHTLQSATLHAIFVADTGRDIGSMTLPDLQRWQKEIRIIAKYAKMTLKEKVFSSGTFRKDSVTHFVRNLHVNKEDAVVFYFSGHGYRTKDQVSPWPTLTFEFYHPGIELEWIGKQIQNKKPRFSLILADCCNNYLEKGFSSPSKQILIKLHQIPSNYPNYEHLFAKAKGGIVISSCSAGEFSYGSHDGGLYTQCFFASLNKELGEKTPSWKTLLRRCNGYINHIQKPVCKVFP